MRRVGLRARLAAALAAIALFAVALAALLGNLGLTPRLDQAARARLDGSATHAAAVAGSLYRDSGGWSRGARTELAHFAALGGLRIAVRLPGGLLLPAGPQPFGAVAQAPVIVNGRPAGTVVVSAAGGTLLTPGEEDLRRSLDQLHVAAAAAAALAAVVAGLLLAQTLSRPLRRIRGAAERLERGDLDARVEPGAGPEMRAVGHALNRLADTLQQEEELRKAGVADLAHEFRTPVSGLLTRIEAAQDGVLPLPENLAAMHQEAQRLTRLLDDLSRLADAERPGLLLARQPADLADIARASAESFAERFAAAGIRFTVTTDPAWVLGETARLEQIVSNLLSNALRYTDAGGKVTLSAGRRGGEAFAEVADTGIGIAPGDLPRIYTRFWRGDRSRSRATGGTGIGLTIVRELVRAHDGRIDVDSAPGRGSRFRVTLPALASHPAPSPARAPRGDRKAPGQR